MGPRAGLDRCGNLAPPTGFDPRTVQPVASRYTGYAPRPREKLKGLVNKKLINQISTDLYV